MTFADGNNTGGNAKATGSRGVSGSYGAASWGGPIFFKADANNNLQDFELSTAMASDEMMDSGEANNVVEVTFDELQVRFKDVLLLIRVQKHNSNTKYKYFKETQMHQQVQN